MEKTYYIYHIPGLKYGCTQNYPERPASQSEVYELTEMHTDIMIASKREKELNIAADYPWSDTQYYYKMVENGKIGSGSNGGKISGPIQGRKNVQSGQWAICKSLGGKTGKSGKSQVKSGHWEIVRQVGNKINQERIACEYCGTIANRLNHGRWHGPNCKLNPLKSS